MSLSTVCRSIRYPSLFKEDDDGIEFISAIGYNLLHLINHQTYLFQIKKDRPKSYNAILSIDLRYLPHGTYTMAFEMKFSYQIDQNNVSVDAASDTLTQVSTKTRIINFDYGYYSRSIINFRKSIVNPGIDDLDIDLHLPLKDSVSPKPNKTPINVSVYGIRGNQSDIPIQIWDRYIYINNKRTYFEAPIDMNGKDITGVNKIVTDDLDVNGQINMKNKKIIGVGDGTANSDAVNKAQLDAVKTQVTQNKTDIATINTNNGYYYYTNDLKHDNTNNVKFPSITNSYPYSNGTSDSLRISLSGQYHIIYTDFYKGGGLFKIYDDTNSINLFNLRLDNQKLWTPITINAMITIQADNGFGHADIKLYLPDNSSFDGAGYSTLYNRCLHN